jgi:hypothetical protein
MNCPFPQTNLEEETQIVAQPTQERIDGDGGLIGFTQETPKESRLKTILLGTPEQREAREKAFAKDLKQSPGKYVLKVIFDPSYLSRSAFYLPQEMPTELKRSFRLFGSLANIGTTACYGINIVAPIAAKLGEYFAK